MASTPVTPAAVTASAVPTVLDNWITLFKAHEKFLTLILAGALAFHFYGTALNAWVNHDKAAQTIEEQKSATLAQQNSVLAQQGAQLLATVTASNAALVKAATQRAEQTKAQQVADMTLPLPQVGQHWVSLINVAPADIQAQPDGSMKVSDAASRATVSQLDAGVEAAADLKGAQQTAVNNQTVINQQTQQIISDKDIIAQDKTTCDSEKSTLKAQNKKSFWTGFKWGIGVGIGVSAAVVLHKVL